MKYNHLGSAYGREIYGPGEADDAAAIPQGYSIAAVVLKNGWKSDELGWLLNSLYGALDDDWAEFKPEEGARSFVFYGERAEEASNLCDTFAYAWTGGAEERYNDIVAASNDAADLDAFVEAVLTGEIAVGDAYADTLRNTIFAVLVSDPPEDDDGALVDRVANAVKAAAEAHRFD